MKIMDMATAEALMNRWAGRGEEFLFVIDYKAERAIVERLADVNPAEILYDFGDFCNYKGNSSLRNAPCGDSGGSNNRSNSGPRNLPEIQWSVTPPDKAGYLAAFNRVMAALRRGDSFLINLTCRMPVTTNLSLRDIFVRSRARYRLWVKNMFTCFSPEIFVRIDHGRISSFPMKGTLPATGDDALARLMNNPKEAAEHATIVDLIRNDLSMAASDVRVARYRYAETLTTSRGPLLETSSEIVGQLPADWSARVGTLLRQMLPAGSITGAPKIRTMEVIAEAEGYDRGFYTGVMGCYAAEKLDSAVMIRFVDTDNGQLYFKAGGGITAKSDAAAEYQEVIDKAYISL